MYPRRESTAAIWGLGGGVKAEFSTGRVAAAFSFDNFDTYGASIVLGVGWLATEFAPVANAGIGLGAPASFE